MSDGIVAILGVGFLAGITVTLICLGVSYAMDNNKRQHGTDLDMRVYVPSRLRNRGGNHRQNKQMGEMTSETLAAIIRTMSATMKIDDNESAYLSETADRLEKLDKLEKWMEEQLKK